MAFTEDQLKAAAKKAYAAGDMKAAQELFEQAKTARAITGGAPDGMTVAQRIAAAKDGTLAPPSDATLAKQADIDAGVERDIRDRGALHAMAFGAGQGATFGFGDEIVAGVGAALSPMTYDDALKAVRGELEAAREIRPKTTMGAEIGSGVLSALGGLGVAAKAAPTLAGKAAVGAGVGAAEGGLYGFGSGEGGFQNRATEAGKTAAIGGLVGGAAPALIAGVKGVGSAIANPIASALNIPSNVRASAAIEKMMGRAGMTADDANNAIARAGAEGQPDFLLADALGNAGQRGLSGVARQPGDARQMIAETLMKRQDGQGNRISTFIADALDAPNTAKARGADLTADMRKTAKASYDAAAAGAAPVDVRPAVATLTDTIDQMSGSGMTPPRIVAEFDKLRGKLAGQTAKGEPTTLSDYNSVLALWREVKDDIDKAFRAGDGSLGEALKPVRDQLEAALSEASDGFKTANAKYRADKAVIGALDEGAAAASPRVRAADTVDRVAKLTPEQRAAFAGGYADPVLGRVESAAPGVNKARPLLNEKTKAELGVLAKDPALLERQLARENTMFETNVAALGGSKTADNLADIADTSAMSASVIGNVVSGRWGAAAGQLADKLMAGATGTNPATREIIAKALLSRNPAAALAPIVKRRGVTEPVERVLEALMRSTAIRQ